MREENKSADLRLSGVIPYFSSRSTFPEKRKTTGIRKTDVKEPSATTSRSPLTRFCRRLGWAPQEGGGEGRGEEKKRKTGSWKGKDGGHTMSCCASSTRGFIPRTVLLRRPADKEEGERERKNREEKERMM